MDGRSPLPAGPPVHVVELPGIVHFGPAILVGTIWYQRVQWMVDGGLTRTVDYPMGVWQQLGLRPADGHVVLPAC